MKTRLCALIFLLSCVFSCSRHSENNTRATNGGKFSKGISEAPFGTLRDGTQVSLYTMINQNGVIMKVINYGGIIVSLEVPDRNGKMIDVVLGYDVLQAYEKCNPFFGALVGRYGNRIAKGKLVLDGKEYKLTKNSNGNHIHWGRKRI